MNVIKCPNCGKDQRKIEIEKVNKEKLNEYKNQLKNEITESIQNNLREGFKAKLKQIDDEYISPNAISSLRNEIDKLKKKLKLLEKENQLGEDNTKEFFKKTMMLKIDYVSLKKNEKATYKSSIEEFFKKTNVELQNHCHSTSNKLLYDLRNRKEKLSKEMALKNQELEIDNDGLERKKQGIQMLEKEITTLMEEVYKAKLEEEEGKKKKEILRKALN